MRPAEIRPFMTFILILATICAVGVLWEYRFEVNYFYAWSEKLLPGFLHIAAGPTGRDEVGRPEVIGPADVSLEVVAMLTMALPIALVRLLRSGHARERLLYGLAACILLAATVATYRKSALLAPFTVLLVLAYFQRRELLRLAPLGAIVLVALMIHTPHALTSIIEQVHPNRLGVSTVGDRVSDYDAIRPDLLSNPGFGRGYGSYEHTSYRILDNELLDRIVETGLIGLAAFVLMLVLMITIASPIIRGRDPAPASQALAVASAAGAFLVLSVLFDILSFPQTVYIFMVLAGFLAVIIRAETDDPGSALESRPRRAADVSPAPRGAERAPGSMPVPV